MSVKRVCNNTGPRHIWNPEIEGEDCPHCRKEDRREEISRQVKPLRRGKPERAESEGLTIFRWTSGGNEVTRWVVPWDVRWDAAVMTGTSVALWQYYQDNFYMPTWLLIALASVYLICGLRVVWFTMRLLFDRPAGYESQSVHSTAESPKQQTPKKLELPEPSGIERITENAKLAAVAVSILGGLLSAIASWIIAIYQKGYP